MLNTVIPDFTLPATGNNLLQLSALRGKKLLLFFYPKDNTTGCSLQAAQYRDLYPEFSKLNCHIYGVSRDSLKSHENFKAKLDLPFELLSDSEELACSLFSVIKQKKLYGKLVRGIERSAFLIDQEGVLRQEWRGVKADGNAAIVLKAVQTLSAHRVGGNAS